MTGTLLAWTQKLALEHFTLEILNLFTKVTTFTPVFRWLLVMIGLWVGLIQCQCCDNSAMMPAILFSLKSMELLENGLQPYSGATPLFSMRTQLLASWQSCHTIATNIWCICIFENNRNNSNKNSNSKNEFCTHSLRQHQSSNRHNVKVWRKRRRKSLHGR